MLKFLASFFIAAMVMPLVTYAKSRPKDAENPSGWQRIYPVKECMEFHLVYLKQGNQYYLTYLTNLGGLEVYKDPYITVKSISDLASVADIIAGEASKRCQSSAVTSTNPDSCNPLDHLDPEFVKLVQAAANAVGKNGDKCKELTRYMELHDKIVGLDAKNPIEISKASNIGNAILKIFTNSTNDQLIDHFEECGGKAQSHKFIENLMLVEFHRSCVMPKPPGFLSWTEARDIAAGIGLKHKNKSILTIRDEKPSIEKEALIELARVVSLNQIKELMPQVDASKTLNSLDSFKKLQEARSVDEFKDYIKLVYTPNVAIELAEKSLQDVVSENMMAKLPADWSEEKKNQYIKDVLMPKAKAGFNECIEKPKVQSNYGHKAAPQINLNYRVWQRDEFCKKYKSVCLDAQKPECTQSNVGINLLSMDPKISDADIAKSCILNGLSRVIEPVFGLIMNTQVDSVKDEVKLPEDLAERFTESSWKQFQACINTHPITKKQFKENQVFQPIYHSEGTNSDAFLKMNPEEFKKLYGDCSGEVERKVTMDFIEVYFISNEYVVEMNPDGPKVDFHGTKYPAGAVQYTQSVVKKNIDKCYEQQKSFYKAKSDFEPSPVLCAPLLEIELGTAVIEDKLKAMFEENQLRNDKEAQRVLTEFSACTSKAYQGTLQAISNPVANPPLKDSDDVDQYLAKDNSFYDCIETTIVATSKIIGGQKFRTTIYKQKSSLKNYDSVLAMEKDVKGVVGACFEKELKKAGSWPALQEFNAKDGLTTAIDTCSKAAEKYAIPKIMLKETVTQVQGLQKQGLLGTPTDATLVVAQAAEDMKASLKLTTDSALTGDKHLIDIFGEGYETYLESNPKATLDDYITYFKKAVTKRAVDKVRNKLLEKVKADAKTRYALDLSALDASITNQCVLDLYNNMSGDMQLTKSSSASLNIDELTGQIVDGLNYLKKSPPPAFQAQMDKIASFCKDAKSYKNIDDIKKSGLLDFVVKAQIHEKTVAAFKKMAKESYDEEIKKYKGTDYFAKVKPFIEKKYKDMLTLISEKLEDRGAFEKMMFPDQDSPIISYALDNLDSVTKDGSEANKKLNQLVLAQMFKDRSKNGFASKFSATQIVNTVGMEGYKQAETSIYDSLKDHPNIRSTVAKYAKESLNRNWTLSKVHSRIGWYDLPDFTRNDLIDSVYSHAIVPVANGDDADSVSKEKGKLGTEVTAHLDGWHKDGKVFKEVFSDEIQAETMAEIKKRGKWEATEEFMWRFWVP